VLLLRREEAVRVLIETRWFTIDITTPRPEQTSQGVESSGQGTYELAYDDRIGFRAPLHDHPEA
jgi:hypothetical protein